MTDYEICQAYKQAKDKKEQVKILADLNDTIKSRIIRILRKGGVYEDKPSYWMDTQNKWREIKDGSIQAGR